MSYVKFRMWNHVRQDHKKSKMFYDIKEVMKCLKQQMLYDYKNKLGYDHVGDGSVFMLSTGLKDKNGTEIYEGDIITFGRDQKYKVIFEDSCFYLYHHEGLKEIDGTDYRWGPLYRVKEHHFDSEVIGNIYETII